ncbi:MAG: hypothetical protein AB2L14_37960 [Candidatus Xenobiia bacterium LiM19]
MQINIHAQDMMKSFYETGTLGQGAQRKEFEGAEDTMIFVMPRVNDCAEIAAFDNTAGDNDKTDGVIDLRPEDAVKLVVPGFGDITSCKAEFKGTTEDMNEMTLEINGTESRLIKHMALSGDNMFIFEARSKGDKGLITASKLSGDVEAKGYVEMLEIPWHMAR